MMKFKVQVLCLKVQQEKFYYKRFLESKDTVKKCKIQVKETCKRSVILLKVNDLKTYISGSTKTLKW